MIIFAILKDTKVYYQLKKFCLNAY